MPRQATTKVGLIFDTADEHKTLATGLRRNDKNGLTEIVIRRSQNLATRPEADGRTKEPWDPTRDHGRSSETAERRDGGCVRKERKKNLI